MRLDPRAPVIVVPVELIGELGSRTLDMALDTGATYTMIPWRVAEALGYDPGVARRRVVLTTPSGLEVAPLITLRGVKALGYEASQVEVVCHDLPVESGVQGLLGLSFLRHLNLDLHLKSGQLEARDP